MLRTATAAFAAALAFATAAPAAPSPVKFVMHRVGEYRSEACGVGDFNNDGRLDIIAGPFWYEAPDWKPHEFRKLKGNVGEDGKGYRHDFMNAPLDVDGDGWLDLVTCCWFSKRIDWYRNTGPDGGRWPMTVAHKNGNYETGDLVDIDGDGKALEVLPATRDTCWHEAVAGANGTRQLVRRDISGKNRPFGAGAGDINGDGRPDIIRPNAWFEAPADIRTGTWKDHPLALGSMTPGKSDHTPQILVYDVDADGRNDIVTSSAHRHGIFWYRQVREGGRTAWRQHVIDKSWSQAHSLALADIDGDGDKDLVTGKRFLAHNGNDPDARGTLGVYWYELERDGAPKWSKHVVSYGQGIGSGLNVPVVDMDGDGDLDIVVTGKWGGPVWFENSLKTARN
ncbi:MAG: FG-GAP repeat domain-containing protein [Planctomycetota bacterium]